MTNEEINKIDFPKSIWEFILDNSFKDTENVYSNGVLLIPTYRVKQAIEHYYEPIEGNGTLTNGDVIKAIFPSVEVKEKNNGYEVYFGVGTAIQFFNHQWWNSPYKECDSE